ncbi:MAG: methyl-accepting chemotaxis protein [Clostridiales bacterium]|nr:methyl-accepting chemotaxis protein [Clostridiales bacterium]
MTALKRRGPIRARVAAITMLISVLIAVAIAIFAFFTYRNSVYSLTEIAIEQVNSSAWRFSLTIVAIGAVVGLLGGLLIQFYVSRSLTFALKRLVTADYTFSRDSNFKARDTDAQSNDDIARLYSRFSDLSGTVQELMMDIQDMAEAQVRGEDDAFVDEKKYQGGLRDLAKSVNGMVKVYQADFVELITVAKKYGEGDFSVNVSEYPGNWKWANDAVDGLRDSFIHITKEVNKINNNAIKGNFDMQADLGNQKGEWAVLLTKLNDFCRAVNEPLLAVEHNVILMSKGDFTPLEGNFSGKFKVLQDACNEANVKLNEHVDEIAHVLRAMAGGDLTQELRQDYPGSYMPIKKALITILDSLNASMKDITKASEQVLGGATTLADSARSLADGTTEQAVTIDELNSSIALIEEKTHFNSKRAGDADDLARLSNEHARVGNEKMQSMLNSMDNIKLSSDNISKIIKTIEGIAFQTNLLSINASVEAARAGAHGTGFAVVAEEVGNLASRSQKATKESSQLILDSIASVDNGSSSAQLAASTLDSMVDSARQVSELVSQIAVISKEQATAIAELNKGIGHISDIVQSNAATSEECSALASEFTGHAQVLMDMVAFYKIR